MTGGRSSWAPASDRRRVPAPGLQCKSPLTSCQSGTAHVGRTRDGWGSAMAQRATYHHGDLRAALVDAALELVAQKGVAGLSVAEAARLAGVSSAAPYRHFASRTALLSAAATVARRQLSEQMAAAGEELAARSPRDGDPVTVAVEPLASLAAVYVRY